MSQSEEDLREILWTKLQAIRGSYSDPESLRTLLKQWEEDACTKYQHIVDELIGERASNYWRSISAREGAGVEDLVRTQWEPWTEGEFSIEKTQDGVKVFCTKCPISDGYRLIGREDYGYLFHCAEDAHIVAGFNPKIVFKRTKTLMEGDDCCDFYYSMK